MTSVVVTVGSLHHECSLRRRTNNDNVPRARKYNNVPNGQAEAFSLGRLKDILS